MICVSWAPQCAIAVPQAKSHTPCPAVLARASRRRATRRSQPPSASPVGQAPRPSPPASPVGYPRWSRRLIRTISPTGIHAHLLEFRVSRWPGTVIAGRGDAKSVGGDPAGRRSRRVGASPEMSDPRAIFEQTSKTTGHSNEFRFE